MSADDRHRGPLTRFTGSIVLAGLSCLIFAVSASLAGAQDASENFDPGALRPADTSSPRATLRSFLDNAREAILDWREEDITEATYRMRSRAVETLDLSATPNNASWSEQTKRLLLLKEILDRIELPSFDEIPGDAEVADEDVTSWTIPETRITIARVEEGTRAGEFLFSADTVAQLDRFYNQARSLPYKPEATPGAYNDFLKSGDPYELTASLGDALRPIDYSSPRAALQGFLESVNRAYALVMDADAASRATPPTVTAAQARKVEAEASRQLQRAVGTLDLSQVPEALRRKEGLEAVLKLKEVLDRVPLPPLDFVPDAQMVIAAREGSNHWSSTSSGPLRWKVPETAIEIVEIADGPRQGEFLFSADTVRNADQFYRRVENLPYRKNIWAWLYADYVSPQTSDGFYKYYISSPGYLVPSAHFLGSFLADLPAWLTELHYKNTVWQWLGLAIAVVLLALAVLIAYFAIRHVGRRSQTLVKSWVRALLPFAIAGFVLVFQDFVTVGLGITGPVLPKITTASNAVFAVMLAWASFAVCKALAETIIASPRIAQQSLDASLLRIGARILGFVVAAWVVIKAVQNLGIDIIPLLAGLGIGGLAVALAAQTTLANFIGGILLYANRPVRIGDFCAFGDKTGTIESIGLQSTRIRALDRTLITVPNASFSNMQIINWADCDQMLIHTTIGLRYETKLEQLRYVLAKLREMFVAHPKIDNPTVRVRFVGYGASSLDIEIRVYALAREFNDFFAIQEDVLLRVAEIVEESGTSFAFPSQTLYLGRDDGLDVERGEAAARQVQSWRHAGHLPFPNMAREQHDRLADSLDYPPRGSPDASGAQALEAEGTDLQHAEPLSTAAKDEGTEDEEKKKRDQEAANPPERK